MVRTEKRFRNDELGLVFILLQDNGRLILIQQTAFDCVLTETCRRVQCELYEYFFCLFFFVLIFI